MIFTKIAALAECLCEQINDPSSGVPGVCFCGIVPGEVANAEYLGDCDGCGGMAWVRLANAYPSVTVGVADVTTGNCSKGLGVDVEIGIMRCMPVAGDESGAEPVKPEDLLAAALIQHADVAVMHRALRCCSALDPKDFIIGQYTPLGPEGGVVGGFITISMAV